MIIVSTKENHFSTLIIMFLEHMSKNHVTLKTSVMAAENSVMAEMALM